MFIELTDRQVQMIIDAIGCWLSEAGSNEPYPTEEMEALEGRLKDVLATRTAKRS